MMRRPFRFTFFLLICIALPLTATAQTVNIPDPNLRAAIEAALGKASGVPITVSDMANLTQLEAPNANINDLTGLEQATNLTRLNLGTESTRGDDVNSNSISDLSPLAGLTNLTWLRLRNNSISDISPLAGLTQLTWLNIGGNPMISDISVLSGLTNLGTLWLWGTPMISDISPLTGLTQLTWLSLWGNSISDISPLVANTGLGSGDAVNVRINPLSYLSLHTHIPTLQSRGVTVDFDNQAHLALLKISGDNQKGVSGTALPDPFVVEVQDEIGSTLAGIPVTFAITAGGGALSTTRTTTDSNGRALTTLTLGPNLGTNTVSVSATNIEVLVTFHAISDTESPVIPGTDKATPLLAGVTGEHRQTLTGHMDNVRSVVFQS